MKTRTSIFYFSAVLLIWLSSNAQEFQSDLSQINPPNQIPEKQISFHNLNVDKGLSQNSVVSIAQDSIGYLWFATQDGLYQFKFIKSY